ncbi:dipeptidase [Rubrivirga sp. S365]|uniref:Dipeptidase n=1 Tax=Rubrivirga litoralis TaxID=3075598 RepID=A0ABU3BPB5_9BACT|nr:MULTISPECIES: dipeptidase [unclassified Rubrivirga]MDT0631085.1 dipeptidase [Rubrivirga sp. F394]MDT7855402.1 dipeptidase [Rubrivirga sp. S365]
MDSALQYARDHADRFVEELKAWLRIPSISTDPEHDAQTRRAADWLAQRLRDAGLKTVDVLETGSAESPGHPVVYAEHHVSDDAPTVLVYGHYDVQPPDPLELWDQDPFEPVEVDGDLVARGAADDKGQAFMHVKAVEAYLQSGDGLPVNLKMMVEGEEENGSVHLAPFIEANRDRLAADVVLVSDTALFAPGVPSIAYGLRGLAYVEVELEGPARDLHSGVYGGGVENPINALARMIADLHDDDHRVTVEGFYDDVRELTDEERAGFRELPFDEARWQEEAGVEATKTEAGYSVLEGTTARPTLDVNGIWGGYTGKGAKTVLPSKATAKISCRLVPDQTPDDITEKLRRHFETHAPETMRLTFRNLHGGHGAIVDTSAPAMQAAAEALEGVFGQRPHFTREGGSIPVVADFKRLLGLDTVLMGFGLDSDAIHSPNERFGLDRFHQGIEASVRFLDAYARQAEDR